MATLPKFLSLTPAMCVTTAGRFAFARYKKYRDIMDSLTLDPEEFEQLQRAFMGGHTHANAKHVRRVLHNVGSYDLTSSYPSVMVLEKFPMSQAHYIQGELNFDTFLRLIKTKACVFDLVLTELEPILHFEHPISSSKCWIKEEITVDNGRVITAQRIATTCTEQDFMTYITFYKWKSMKVYNLRYYDKQYLPHQFVNAILKIYKDKTELKDVEGQEVAYMVSKNMMNSTFGMSVTNPVRDVLEYGSDDEYRKSRGDPVTALKTYNESKRRFLFYPWGVWVTAYARRNLFTAIESMGSDFVYSDTDSVKMLHHDRHKEYFSHYNEVIQQKIYLAAEYHHLSPDEFSPLNRKGIAKTIGIWDFEGIYDEFKTLGAKRYMYRKGDHYVLTVAGANKKTAMEYLLATGNPFAAFDNNLTIPSSHSGRLTSTYLDYEQSGTIVDYLGQSYTYHEKSSIHLEPSDYNLTMSYDFLDYLMEVRENEPE